MGDELTDLERMKKPALQVFWRERFGEEAPKRQSAGLLRWRIAWRLQERIHGGLPARTKRRLTELANAFQRDSNHLPHATPRLRPGTLLTREWQGMTHTVQVLEAGFMHEGRKYSTLSSVARAITGTRWSGPAFFGLKKRAVRAGDNR